ncbi:MAG: serine/threonine protein kinase [Polyangiaceae bacterium]|nr:serine/threonine protein kinase [Polyangiaceae bacterium]
MANQHCALACRHGDCFRPGTVVDRKYRIDALVGTGGMGFVYRAWNLTLEQWVAIKVLRPEYAHDPEAAAQVANEARAMARLRGIHVGRVLDVGRTDAQCPYVVLEYLQGHTLRAELEARGRLELAQAVNVVLQACEAVAEAHAAGIVHCDLKPENLVLALAPDGTQVLKVIDFGISRRTDADPNVRPDCFAAGSPRYMAPEQLVAPESVDERADVWSLGVVLFELLTGHTPFAGDSLVAMGVKLRTAQAPSLCSVRPDLPTELENVVQRCLSRLPENRIASVAELADALSPFAEQSAIQSVRRVRRILGGGPARANVLELVELDEEDDQLPFEPTQTGCAVVAEPG